MRVAGAHDKVARDVVIFAGLEAVDVTRRDVESPQHDRHGRGKIFAMSRALLEEEVGKRVGLRWTAEVQGIAVMRVQIALNRPRLIVWSFITSRDLPSEVGDARVERGQLQIRFANRVGINCAGLANGGGR